MHNFNVNDDKNQTVQTMKVCKKEIDNQEANNDNKYTYYY